MWKHRVRNNKASSRKHELPKVPPDGYSRNTADNLQTMFSSKSFDQSSLKMSAQEQKINVFFFMKYLQFVSEYLKNIHNVYKMIKRNNIRITFLKLFVHAVCPSVSGFVKISKHFQMWFRSDSFEVFLLPRISKTR